MVFETHSLGYSIPEGHFRMCRWTGYVFLSLLACEQAFGRAGNYSLLFFSPNREPVHRLESFSLRTQTYLWSSDVCVRRLWVFRIPTKNYFFQNHPIPLCQFKTNIMMRRWNHNVILQLRFLLGSSLQQTNAPPCGALDRFRKFDLGRLAIKKF